MASIGISQISIKIPDYFISTKELAQKRNLPSEYATKGIGIFKNRILYNTSLENLAIAALKKINFKGVERFFIATESDPDASKPLGIKILSSLKIEKIPFQCKFACLAGMEALILACEYCQVYKKAAIVLAFDRSLYQKTNPKAELTQGAAVVALRIEKNPKILELNFKKAGQFSEDIDDFRVPPNFFPFPKVRGELTKPAFLECLKKAVEDWQAKNKIRKKSLVDYFDFFVMHTPFPKIVEWAAAMFWRHEKMKEKEHLGLTQCLKNPNLFSEYKKELDEIRKSEDFKIFFEKKVKPGLKYNSFIGNAYTASVFISLIGALEEAKRNQRIGISGYGSGAGSIFLEGKVLKNNFKSDLFQQIKRGKKLKIEEYEKWRKNFSFTKFS